MTSSKVRLPAVAGQFYNSSRQGLRAQIESAIDKQAQKADALACVLPHAGYMYSGQVAGYTVSCINIKEKVVLLGPNHTGLGVPFSIMTEGIWQTPLGEVAIDTKLARAILKGCRYLEDDLLAHVNEHSLEVELPFLQYFKPDFQIVPIAFSSGDITLLGEIGRAIASVIKELSMQESVMLVASSDMTHYEPQGEAVKKDTAAIEAILALDEERLERNIRKLDISMCGYAPVITMLCAAKALGATKARLVKYQTSGDVTQDKTSVVGYAGIVIS